MLKLSEVDVAANFITSFAQRKSIADVRILEFRRGRQIFPIKIMLDDLSEFVRTSDQTTNLNSDSSTIDLPSSPHVSNTYVVRRLG